MSENREQPIDPFTAEDRTVTSWACYLARPLDQVSRLYSEAADAWRALRASGAIVYDPGAWSQKPDGNPFPQHVHDAALAHADGMLAILPDDQATIGVPMELERFWASGRPAVVLGGEIVSRSPVLAARGILVFAHANPAAASLAASVTELRAPVGDVDAEPLSRFGNIPSDLRADLARFWIAMRNEIERGIVKHPKSNDPAWTTTDRWFAICVEELLEGALAIVQRWNDVYHHDPAGGETFEGPRVSWEDVRAELVQMAAMSMRLWRSIGESA